ncbi:MAG TPA: iron ABC transporter permease [Trueperaceae bacterium]
MALMQETLAAATVNRAGVRWTPLALGSLLLAAVMLVAVAIGTVPLGPAELLRGVWHGLIGEVTSTADVIVWQIRLPRVLLAALVGGALALAGVAYQGIFRNPLADPYLLGVASGASLGAAVAITLGVSLTWVGRFGVPGLSFAFALLAVLVVLLMARRGNRIPVLSLILAGVVVGSTFTAATSFLMLLTPERTAGVLAWLLGSFSTAGWSAIVTIFPFLLLAALCTLLAGRTLNLLQLGDEQAAQLGVPVEAAKLLLIAVATLATAAAVSVSGIIGFVGLLAPHAVRLALGPDHRTLTPLAMLLGALVTVLADLLARTVIAPAEIPIGVVTALVGGPFFLWLLRKQRNLL